MDFKDYFPIFKKLDKKHQECILNSIKKINIEKGSIIHDSNTDCPGMIVVFKGQLRAYILSDEGREIVIYRLFDRDICLFSASCIIQSIQFDILIEAEKDTIAWVIPSELYKEIMEDSAPLANYTNEIMASRFSDVIWLIEQIMWKSMDKRVAEFLLEEKQIESSNKLKITHEKIANHLGSHREVITRMLKYLQNEGIVKVSRGVVTILDEERLKKI